MKHWFRCPWAVAVEGFCLVAAVAFWLVFWPVGALARMFGHGEEWDS